MRAHHEGTGLFHTRSLSAARVDAAGSEAATSASRGTVGWRHVMPLVQHAALDLRTHEERATTRRTTRLRSRRAWRRLGVRPAGLHHDAWSRGNPRSTSLPRTAYRVPISDHHCDTADEHQRFDKATGDLRNDAHSVEVYEIATLGRGLTGSRIATRSAPRARRALAPQGTGASRSPHGSPVRVGTGRARCHLATGRRAFGTDPCASLARGSAPHTGPSTAWR